MKMLYIGHVDSTCPKCETKVSTPDSHKEHVCSHCGTRWPLDKPRQLQPVPVVEEGGSVIGILGVALILIIGLIIVYLIFDPSKWDQLLRIIP